MLPFFDSGQFGEWAYQNFIALDQAANAFFNGSADETFSSRCYRMNDRNPYKWLEKAINWLYTYQGADHCHKAYLKEMAGRHRPITKQEK